MYTLSRSSTLISLYCSLLWAQPQVPGRNNGGEDRKALQYFSESSNKDNEMRVHITEKLFVETGLISILFIWNQSRENSPNSLPCFVLLLHPVV